MLEAIRGALLQKHLGFVLALESLDANAALAPRQALMAIAKRGCDTRESGSCQTLTEMLVSECRFNEAEIAHESMIAAQTAEIEAVSRLVGTCKAENELRKSVQKLPRRPPPAIFSEERRQLCERVRSSAR